MTGPASVSTISFGDAHSVAITPAGEIWTWGESLDGRLGNGTTTPDRLTPQLVYSGIPMWPAAAPAITPPSGNFETAQTVTITASDATAAIRYTLDGTLPTEASPLYSAPFEVNVTTTIKARVFPINGGTPSEPSTSVVTFVFGSLSAPAASPGGGIRPSTQVALTAEEGTTIRYTLDGLTPTASSTVYAVPISITAGVVTLKAKAFKAGWVDSSTMTETYTIDNVPPTHVASLFPSPVNGWNNTPVTISFHCTDNLGVVDCPAPVTVSTEGAGQEVSRSATDQAGNQSSAGGSLNVDVTGPLVALTSPSNGLVTTNGSVTLTASASDAISGVVSVTCNGVSASLINGQVSCEVPLRNGVNSLVVAAQDAAGNSGSAGVRVTRVGTATSLALAPSTGTKLIGDEFSMSLRDEFGVLAEAASWETSDSGVISLSTDDPPLLTAVGAGTATITATKNGLSATATVAVVAGSSLPDGTVKWSIESLGTQPISVNTADPEGPATFTSTFEAGVWAVNALSADGRHLWTEAAPGQPVMADHAGALVAYTGSSTGLARFAGPAEAAPWRHQATGTLLTIPAQAPDGTIYVIDRQPATSPRGTAITDAVVLAIDGNTGALKYRYALPRTRYVYDSIFPDALANGCTQPPEEYGGSYEAPVIGSDGRAYVTVAVHDPRVNRRWINNACVDALVEYQSRIELIALSSSGAVTRLEVLNETNDHCSEIPYSKQTLTDGGSGIVITTVTFSNCTANEEFNVAYKTLVVNSAGAITSFPSMAGYSIAMTSDTGTAYLSPTVFGNVVAKDLSTWATKWTAPVAGTPLVPHADDGLTVRGNDGVVFLDGNGVVTGTTSLTIQDVTSVRPGELQGTNAAGAVESVTVSDAATVVLAKSYFAWALGNEPQQRQNQVTCQIATQSKKWRALHFGSYASYAFAGNWSDQWKKDKIIEAFGLWQQANLRSGLNTSFGPPSSGSPVLTLINAPLGNDPITGLPVAAAVLAGYHVDADYMLLDAPIAWSTNTGILSSQSGYLKTALHEIGHLVGLGDSNGSKGSSVMNAMGGKDDWQQRMPQVVTACDQEAAWLVQFRAWSPQ